MKKNFFIALFLMFAMSFLLSSCKKKNNDPEYMGKVGLISGIGGFNDRGFNQAALLGLQAGTIAYPFYGEGRNSFDTSDYRSNMNSFIQNSFDLVITLGFDMKTLTVQTAKQYSMMDFALLDAVVDTIPANLLCVSYQVDQASFLCGFIAAYWAQYKDPVSPIAAYVAGPDIPEIRQFALSYRKGVAYFNTYYQKNVPCLGVNADNFTDTLQGAQLAGDMIREGAEVIFAFAGKTGNGALYKTLEQGKWAIGVDVDQFESIPQVGSILLTSCMKRLDLSVYDIMTNFFYNNFQGGQVFYGNLTNEMVDIAPFHQFDTQIPDSIKDAMETIKIGIQNGTIPTGWPE